MAQPLTDDEKARIVELIQAGHSARHVAAETGRSVDTISRIGKSIGWTFGQTNLARAHEARSSYCADRRAEIARKAADRALELLDGFDNSQPVVVVTKEGADVVTVRPDARAQRDRASAAQTLVRAVLDIDRHDRRDNEGVSAVDEWLAAMTGGTT